MTEGASKKNGAVEPYPYPFSDGLWMVVPQLDVLWIARVVDPEGKLTEDQIANEMIDGGVILSLRPKYIVSSQMTTKVVGGQLATGKILVSCRRADHRFGLSGNTLEHHLIRGAEFLSDMTPQDRATLASYVHEAELALREAHSQNHAPSPGAPGGGAGGTALQPTR